VRSAPALAPADLRAVVLYCGLYDMRTVGGTGFPALRTYLARWTGWLLLALVSMTVAYGALVFAGR
jgi:hypothetical protein